MCGGSREKRPPPCCSAVTITDCRRRHQSRSRIISSAPGSRAAPLSPEANSPQILCAGIVVLDEVFRVTDVPPTDTKADATDFVSVSGGCAANAAVAIARLGGKVAFAGPFGTDDTADRIQIILEREGVDCAGCVRVTGATSSVSAILVNDAGQRTIVTHSDPALLSATAADA